MSVKKRPESPYYYYRFKYKGKSFYSSTGTKIREEAEQIEAKVKRRLWERDTLGIKDPHPWDKAIAKYLNAKKNLSTIEEIIFTLTVFTEGFAKVNQNINLEDINREMVEEIMDDYQDERECSNARVNRMTSMLRGLLNMAANEWNWLEYAPKLRFYKENSKEPRWLTATEAKNLINKAPNHLKDPIRFSLLTGVRKSNCLGLKWSWVSMRNKQIVIPAASVKTKRVISIPITEELRKILLRNIGKHDESVFTYVKRNSSIPMPFKAIDNKDTWQPLLVRAGIENFRWHDLRHTWASWHIMNGTTLSELMELAGWSSYSMVKRYAHLSVDHLRKAAENVSIKEGILKLIEVKK